MTNGGIHVTESETVNGKRHVKSRRLTAATSEYPCWVSTWNGMEAFVTWNGCVSVQLSTVGDPTGTQVPDLALTVSFKGSVAHGIYTPVGGLPSDSCIAGSTFTATAP